MESLKSLLKLALLSEQSLDRVCDPQFSFRFMLCDCVGNYVPRGARPDGQAPVMLGFISYLVVVWPSGSHVPDHCFCVRRFDLLNVHATAGYQNNASPDHKDCTDDVEDCGTDATSGRKNGTGFIGYSRSLFQVCSSIIIASNSKCGISCFVVTSRNSFLNQSICTICKTSKCRNSTSSIRLVLSCIINTVNPANRQFVVSEFVIFAFRISNYESSTCKRLLFTILFCYGELSIVNLYFLTSITSFK